MPTYSIAGAHFSIPVALEELVSFATEKTAASPQPITPPPAAKLLTRSNGLVAGKNRNVEWWSAPPGHLLKVDDGMDVYVSEEGDTIIPLLDPGRQRWPKPQEIASRLDSSSIEILLGPALILALAQQSVFCLHASAIASSEDRVIAFAGESGRGKSTLARHLSQSDQWRLVSDDILPVTGTAGGAFAWPRFPQLKMPNDSQPGALLPERVPLEALFVLEGEATEPAMERCGPADSIQMLLKHTVAARLFDAGLLAQHLRFCGLVAAQIVVGKLMYPRRMDALPAVETLARTRAWK